MFCFILLNFVLFYFILFYFILFYFILFYFILFLLLFFNFHFLFWEERFFFAFEWSSVKVLIIFCLSLIYQIVLLCFTYLEIKALVRVSKCHFSTFSMSSRGFTKLPAYYVMRKFPNWKPVLIDWILRRRKWLANLNRPCDLETVWQD